MQASGSFCRRFSKWRSAPFALSRRHIGECGEGIALAYLRHRGMVLRERNWRARRGEIDLVLNDGGVIVFVEVKTRLLSAQAGQLLFDSIGQRKQRTLRRLALQYLEQQSLPPRTPFRIDLVGVLLDPRTFKPRDVRYSRNAV